MTEDVKFSKIRSKIEENQKIYEKIRKSEVQEGASWHAVSNSSDVTVGRSNFLNSIDFVGKNLENGKFANENLKNANFSVANLTGVDFSGANLAGVDFSGANLTDANLSGADLTGAVLSGAVLHKTNFTGAKLNGVKLLEADFEDAILLDIEIDALGIEELQELIEYIAKNYPHKLNLTKLNLTLLNLQRIDLSKLNLRGVDFTGCDFTGVNIMELDLSECIITPQQIAQALGRIPQKDELAKILAPKKKKAKGFEGYDMSSLFLGDGKEFGVWDFVNDKGISVESLLKVGKKVFRHGAEKPEVKDEEALKNVKGVREQQTKTHNEELRKIIEERKKKELENRAAKKKEFQQEVVKEQEPQKSNKQDVSDRIINRGRDGR
ncbi:MAG: pentapeptide repeat-containing protein [Alphaproteobacteria bacterium]|nr:pentapeptide repeat-containing protein [Alphaproteobacteria bacterium]